MVVGYHKRSRIETTMMQLKTIFGDTVRAHHHLALLRGALALPGSEPHDEPGDATKRRRLKKEREQTR